MQTGPAGFFGSAGPGSWVQVARGAVTLNGKALGAADGAAVSIERSLTVTAKTPAEVLLLDLA
jgi:redox-sensitive bicupin YhaK (pirin superfamily)